MGYDDEGTGADSGFIEAMEWAKAEGAGIVSMSLGSPVPDDGTGLRPGVTP
ncbi:hypothetical protein [Streptomyces sindenensis]|uniref:Peptidase S8/S53 domain-containing protein n=1 Tax=Streptomyces sindenensis TaxID=67363 RepID=A0ABW6EDV9_9ACTN